jgi:hypothetical protein
MGDSKLTESLRIAVPEEDILAWHRKLLDLLRDEALPESIFETINVLQTDLWVAYHRGCRVRTPEGEGF